MFIRKKPFLMSAFIFSSSLTLDIICPYVGLPGVLSNVVETSLH
jgi:hypothetical protein